jgi:2-iminobutanoate/2-iminopropanoate deaminase
MAGATRWGDLLVLSGLAALDVATMRPVADGLGEQADAIFAQLDDLLARGGASRETVLRVECFLADREDFAAWNAAFAAAFGDRPPARTTLVAELPVRGLRLELQALAGCGAPKSALADARGGMPAPPHACHGAPHLASGPRELRGTPCGTN